MSSKTIWTPANIVTCARVVLVPFWLLLAQHLGVSLEDSLATPGFKLGAFLVFIGYVVISLTDKLDGYLARSRNEVTTFGKFLDPIADKLAVVVALFVLLEWHMVSPWVLLVIVAREFLVSGLRMVVASKGVVIAASNLGKWKTATTMVAICGLLFLPSIPGGMIQDIFVLFFIFNTFMWVAVVLTAWSGIDYFVKSWQYIAEV
ncbi:CDP-diacylglycerol--glycerol-3-phosphate 3-phosphatidyltransferase [Lancefieldella parvula]|uniref:CDP-diacylglycerol--glycerol-3-phosphate 3-phosphatidyltransferase n=1 Tax=Lancefieldella parvula TaxID=1382 RepID=UPI0028D065A7|nr:CDP-diacylglycerol--glycerol-3-phosphate 3-phosphatidyltransferase [Lancefieldella parvula]MDU4867568.1 CDP-diacylglycerol--glycerol-3-phosphate 3-phosphatidyltransferase [Lancefieldella parvula]